MRDETEYDPAAEAVGLFDTAIGARGTTHEPIQWDLILAGVATEASFDSRWAADKTRDQLRSVVERALEQAYHRGLRDGVGARRG